MVLSRVAGGVEHSSSSSGIFYQGDRHSQVVGNSHMWSSFKNESNSLPGNVLSSKGTVSGDVSNTVLNSVESSGPSFGASSFVTDANSGLSGGPRFQRSASISAESYIRLPASPMSFSSNNISISGSSGMDGSSVVQQKSNQEPNSQQLQPSLQYQGASSVTSLFTSRVEQIQLSNGPGRRVPESLGQDHVPLSYMQKKPRLDIKQDDIQQQVLQQLLQRQDPLHLQNPNPQLQALIQQQGLRQQQQQLLQSMSPIERSQLLQQQQLHLRQQLQQQAVQPVSAMKHPSDSVVCSRRLMQYLYHQRQRPPDNSIAYWRKFVAEYYSPRAKKRWCLSLYDSIGHPSLGVFPQATVQDEWHCDICRSKSGRGFEATFEALPRLNEIKFGSGVIDELLFLDFPRECRFPSGLMKLECAKAVQETVYEQLRVVQEGQLRIVFSSDLKILSWEFCARHHEELLPRRLIAPQVNQLLQVAQKCLTTLTESGSNGVSHQDIEANSTMVISAGRQLARSLEMQPLNDLGFSRRHMRCLQIAEVVNSMKDLMDFCGDHKVGPIEGLKNFPRHVTAAKLQVPTDHSALNKIISLHPGLNGQINNNQHMAGRRTLSGSAQAAPALTNYQNMLMWQNSMNSNPMAVRQEVASISNSNHSRSTLLQGLNGVLPGILLNLPVTGLSSSNVQQQLQPQQRLLNSNGFQQLQQNHPQSSCGSQALHQQMMQRFLQDMNTNSSGAGQRSDVNASREGLGFGNNSCATTTNEPSSIGPTPCRSNSFKVASSRESSVRAGNCSFSEKAPDSRPSIHQSDEVVPDITQDLTENVFFSDLDNMNCGWNE